MFAIFVLNKTKVRWVPSWKGGLLTFPSLLLAVMALAGVALVQGDWGAGPHPTEAPASPTGNCSPHLTQASTASGNQINPNTVWQTSFLTRSASTNWHWWTQNMNSGAAALSLRADPIFTAARLWEQVGPNQTPNFLWRINQPSLDSWLDTLDFFLASLLSLSYSHTWCLLQGLHYGCTFKLVKF